MDTTVLHTGTREWCLWAKSLRHPAQDNFTCLKREEMQGPNTHWQLVSFILFTQSLQQSFEVLIIILT